MDRQINKWINKYVDKYIIIYREVATKGPIFKMSNF